MLWVRCSNTKGHFNDITDPFGEGNTEVLYVTFVEGKMNLITKGNFHNVTVKKPKSLTPGQIKYNVQVDLSWKQQKEKSVTKNDYRKYTEKLSPPFLRGEMKDFLFKVRKTIVRSNYVSF